MDRYDVLLLLGITLLAIGCGLVYFPLGLIAGGAGCIAIAIVGAVDNARVDARQQHAARGMTAPQKDKA